jgi:uncharacterized membrane protein YeaQ/YmgE (transglycosylase-associated protein family)
MEITGLISAVIIGAIIGAIIGGFGRLVIPGKQRISLFLTILIGIAAALIGTGVATVLGMAHTDGIDWVELTLQIALAGGGVAILTEAKPRNRTLSS